MIHKNVDLSTIFSKEELDFIIEDQILLKDGDLWGFDPDWVIKFLKKQPKNSWSIERDDTGLYWDSDLEKINFMGNKELKEAFEEYDEANIADSRDFFYIPLSNGKYCDVLNDEGCVDHCTALFKELFDIDI
jgi:hypothetical protein